MEGKAEVSRHACFGYEGCFGEEVWVWVDAAFATSSAFCLGMKRAEPSNLSQGFRPKRHSSRRPARVRGLSSPVDPSSTLTGNTETILGLANRTSGWLCGLTIQGVPIQRSLSSFVVTEWYTMPFELENGQRTRAPLAHHSAKARKIVYMIVHTSPGGNGVQ